MCRPGVLSRLVAAGLAAISAGCATAPLPPPADVAQRARAATSYSARLRVALRGPEVRARAAVLLAFRRPDSLRIEVPGPAGARLVAVTHGGALSAVFPGERAFYRGDATASGLEALLGVALAPEEVMDLLLGQPSSRLRRYRARWGRELPTRIEATLPDGGRLQVTVEDAETGRDLSFEAFSEPPHPGYREVSAEEARGLWETPSGAAVSFLPGRHSTSAGLDGGAGASAAR